MVDLTGKKFGRWTVIRHVKRDKFYGHYWWCRCECGTEKSVRDSSLRSGLSKSCGCLRDEKVRQANSKHGGQKL